MSYEFVLAGSVLEPFSETRVKRVQDQILTAKRAQFQARTDAQRRVANQAMTRSLMALYEAQPNEFQLTAGSVVDLQNTMLRLGMLDLDTQAGRFPRYEDYGVTAAIIAEFNETGEEGRELAGFNAMADAVRDRQAENPTGIPLYKIKTNDKWLVTPNEITAALGAYRTSLGEGVPEPRLFWWPYWLDFIERAAKYVGARVC